MQFVGPIAVGDAVARLVLEDHAQGHLGLHVVVVLRIMLGPDAADFLIVESIHSVLMILVFR